MEFRAGDTLVVRNRAGHDTSFERQVTRVTSRFLTLRGTQGTNSLAKTETVPVALVLQWHDDNLVTLKPGDASWA